MNEFCRRLKRPLKRALLYSNQSYLVSTTPRSQSRVLLSTPSKFYYCRKALDVQSPQMHALVFLPSQRRNIPLWRYAKQTTVLSAELGRTFISNLESGAGYVLVFIEHQSPCLIQPQPLLVLQGTHCSELAEVVVKSRCAHLHSGHQFIHAKRQNPATL